MLIRANMQIALKTEKKNFFSILRVIAVVFPIQFIGCTFSILISVRILYHVRVQLYVIKTFAFKLEFRRSRRQVLQQVGGQRLSGVSCTVTA